MTAIDRVFTVAGLRRAYLTGETDLQAVFAQVRERIDRHAGNPVWIFRADEAALARECERVLALDMAQAPLWGIPFAVKDNLDVAGMPTTAACPAFARMADADAPVVAALRAAGAIVVGKTNMDQFATGLTGTRSPWGEVKNAFVPDIISGGSSSGSAVALALGQVAFALGTDTAGSGRVPAALNALVGFKPSRGLLSTRGVVPACRSLDCVSLFTRDVADAASLLPVVRSFDPLDPYSRNLQLDASLPPTLRLGVPRAAQLAFFGNQQAASLFADAVSQVRATGAEIVEIDFQPFIAAASLLYEGPWVAERYGVVKSLMSEQPDALLPVIRLILGGGEQLKADQAFDAMHRLQALRRAVEPVLASVDAVITPTIGTYFTREQISADPVQKNSALGYYTNFMNLLDLAAVAVPHGRFANGLPAGITLFADHGSDARLLGMAARLFPAVSGGTEDVCVADDVSRQDILVCGAHMSGLPLNRQLTSLGAVFREAVKTAPCYRFYALPGGPPFRPAMLRVAAGEAGGMIDAEIWSLPTTRWGEFVQQVPSPLGIGTVALSDGRQVKGFIGEGYAAAGAQDITSLGGWRAFLATRG